MPQHHKINFTTCTNPTAMLMLENGEMYFGHPIGGKGVGAEKISIGEICFNTSMTGYQEIISDPSYAGQIIGFTFPHIGNVGTNAHDNEREKISARGVILGAGVTSPSNWRSETELHEWMQKHRLLGITGVDVRALTHKIRDHGAMKGAICHDETGQFNPEMLKRMSKALHAWGLKGGGLKGMDLAQEVSVKTTSSWKEGVFDLDTGDLDTGIMPSITHKERGRKRVVALDFGAKHNILRCLTEVGCEVELMPAMTRAEDILHLKPDGVFLSNGPGDPAATSKYAGAEIAKLIEAGLPIFGICIGHQLLALAMGGQTKKMTCGHRGANHPVQNLRTGAVEITSQNHGFEVVAASLPDEIEVTHISLFDGSVEGLRHKSKPVFCVQYHPESSPGPHDARYLFQQFFDMLG